MTLEVNGSDLDVKPELLSSDGGLITYTRRKRSRSRSDHSGSPRRTATVLPIKEVPYMAFGEGKGKGKGKNKDTGWEHGEMLPGNRFSWRCKWCGLVKSSGGVTKLKRHLAGVKYITPCNVAPCKKVPIHVARAMENNLLQMKFRRLKRQSEENAVNRMTPDWFPIDRFGKKEKGEMELDMQVSNSQPSQRTVRSLKTASQQSRDSNRQSLVAAQRSKFSMPKVSSVSQRSDEAVKESCSCRQRSKSSYRRSRIGSGLFNGDINKHSMEGTHDTMLCNNSYEEGGPAEIDDHWRSILEDMLHLPNMAEVDGIVTCIKDALMFGPTDLSRKFKMGDLTKDTAEPKDRYKSNCEEQSRLIRPNISPNSQLDVMEPDINDQNLLIFNTVRCQGIFRDILCSEKFVLLCDLLGDNFRDINAEKLFHLSQIDSKMKNKVYGQSPGLFNQDVQEVWRRFQKIGEEIVLLASSLSDMSRDLSQKHVGTDMVHDPAHEVGGPQCEENHHVDAEQKNSNDLNTAIPFPSCESNPDTKHHVDDEQKNSNDLDAAIPFPSCESNPDTKPDQTEASGLYEVCTCKQCGTEANGERSLICDECEAVYHFSCAEPAVQEIPSRSWYCASCTKDKKSLSPDPPVSNSQQGGGLHCNCAVCDRLEFCSAKEDDTKPTVIAIGSRESSISSVELDDPPEPSRTALSRLCKQCGTCEDDDKRFLICGHTQCPYKYYHIRCLKTSQIASLRQQSNPRWYCPSCLCRSCFVDKNDDEIVLCDGCDEAYHTYCMKPPRTSVPEGQWYCIQCNVAKAKEGMRRYEERILQMHGKKEVRRQSNEEEASRPMDVLLSAVEKLSSEEHL